MMTNLLVAYLVLTNVHAFHVSDTERIETVYRVMPYSFTLYDEPINGTNRTEIGRRWMQLRTNLVEVGGGMFQMRSNWVEVIATNNTTVYFTSNILSNGRMAMGSPVMPSLPSDDAPQHHRAATEARAMRSPPLPPGLLTFSTDTNTEAPPIPVIHVKRENGEVLTYRLENTPLPVNPPRNVNERTYELEH